MVASKHGNVMTMKRMLNMKEATVKRSGRYKIDLVKIEGDGSFPCPKCGVVISPDDETEEVYTIVDTKVQDDELVQLTLMCSNCGSEIKLTGFSSLPCEKS
jgi:predicted RNA-binding Zn-ribbon protein involved in translation (DUF1610 family)